MIFKPSFFYGAACFVGFVEHPGEYRPTAFAVDATPLAVAQNSRQHRGENNRARAPDQNIDSEIGWVRYRLLHDHRQEPEIETQLSVREAAKRAGKEEKEGGEGAQESAAERRAAGSGS